MLSVDETPTATLAPPEETTPPEVAASKQARETEIADFILRHVLERDADFFDG